jgi:hypothetical protein
MPPRCRSKGGKALYKVPPSDEELGGQRIMPKTQPRRSRQPGSRPPNLLPDPRLYKRVWTLRLGRSDLLLPPLDRTARGAL